MRNPLTNTAMADWCEAQPPNKTYDLYNPRVCAMSQFARSLGYAGSDAEFRILPTKEGKPIEIEGLNEDALIDAPHTFGALAQRLRA